MEIKQLIYFTETARLQHMTEASLTLNVAQSALSRQIGLLENDLGIELFKREGRNIILTEEGKDFYEDAVKILNMVDATKEKISDVKTNSAQVFNIHITKSDMTAKVMHSFENLLRQYKDITFNIQANDENTIEEKLLEQSLDIAISTKKFAGDNIKSRLLFDQPYYYIFRGGKVSLPVKASLNELEELPLIALDPVMNIKNHFKNTSISIINDAAIIQHLLIHHPYVAVLGYEETKILKYNYPNFTVHSLDHLNIRQPMYISMHSGNNKPFVSSWFNQLTNEFGTLSNRMME